MLGNLNIEKLETWVTIVKRLWCNSTIFVCLVILNRCYSPLNQRSQTVILPTSSHWLNWPSHRFTYLKWYKLGWLHFWSKRCPKTSIFFLSGSYCIACQGTVRDCTQRAFAGFRDFPRRSRGMSLTKGTGASTFVIVHARLVLEANCWICPPFLIFVCSLDDLCCVLTRNLL